MKFQKQLIGYDRQQVNTYIEEVVQNYKQLESTILGLKADNRKLEAEIETLQIQLAAMRRHRSKNEAYQELGNRYIIEVGPVDLLDDIFGLVDDIENCSFITIVFRVFKDHYYKIEASVHDYDGLLSWLSGKSSVQTTIRDDVISLNVKVGA